MTRFRSWLLTLVALALSVGLASAQTTLNSTTTSAAVTATQQIIPLTSVSNISAPTRGVADLIWFDGEAAQVNSIDTTGATVTVTRGVRGTVARPHASGTVVWTGPPRRFYQTDVVGQCTATAEEFLPHINLTTGSVFQCSNSEWVRYRDKGYRAFHAGRADGGTTYTAAGAITIQPGLSFINGTTLAMTLADPTKEQNGLIMIIEATNASAHTVTYTAGFNGGTTARDVATFGGAVGDNMMIIAFNGVWWVISTRNVTLG